MATPRGLLFLLGAALFFATHGLRPVESFTLHFPLFRRTSLLIGAARVSCRRPSPSATASRCRCFANAESTQNSTIGGREQKQGDRAGIGSLSTPTTPSFSKAQDEAGSNDAERIAAGPEPSWVQDPGESRVKMWMRSAASKGDHNRVAMYLRKYREAKVLKGELPRIAVYNTALRALDRCKKWRLALSVFREMQSDGVDPDRDSYFFVMSACSKRGEAKTALALLSEMKAGRQQQQQQRAGGGGGGSGDEEDEDGAPVPDLLLYAVVMKACAWGKRWQQAVRLLDDMSGAGVSPNVVVLNTALSACAKCGQVSRATQLLEEMQEKYGVAPEARSYNSVISGHERAGEWREALALAKRMEQAGGVSPNVVTFNSVIGACKTAGRPEEALAVLGMLRRKGLQPDVISFNSAIGACASGGKWEAALQLLELMPSEGVTPDLMTYNIALDACVK
ncbi:unnamed protein product, partial [Ectocarpus fasciculatus]